jgi:hypothetical protein
MGINWHYLSNHLESWLQTFPPWILTDTRRSFMYIPMAYPCIHTSRLHSITQIYMHLCVSSIAETIHIHSIAFSFKTETNPVPTINNIIRTFRLVWRFQVLCITQSCESTGTSDGMWILPSLFELLQCPIWKGNNYRLDTIRSPSCSEDIRQVVVDTHHRFNMCSTFAHRNGESSKLAPLVACTWRTTSNANPLHMVDTIDNCL